MRSRATHAAGAVAVTLVVLVLAVAQLVLPGIAAQHLRDELSVHGRVLNVQVDAFPAIELLWHHADRVVVRMANYSAGTAALARQVAEIRDTGALRASAGEFRVGLLTLHDAILTKQGGRVTASGTVAESDLRSALPVLDAVVPLSSANGQLTLRGTGTLLGVTATVDASVRAVGGALVVSPDVPFGSLATITLFSNPQISVQGISAAPVPGGFTATVSAQMK